MIDLNKLPFNYWSNKMKISYLQRRIIVHSIIYYVLNESVISDKEFDELSKQLVKLQNKNKNNFIESEYYYCMFDFDGSTGFHLYDRLIDVDKEKLMRISKNVLKNFKGGKQ